MTSLQKGAAKTQKWPLINIVRQILKSYGYKMRPLRVANGYTKAGKKLYRRFFIVEKKMNNQEIDNSDSISE